MDPAFRNAVPPVTSLTIVVLVTIFVIYLLTGEFKAERHTFKPETGFEPSKWYRFFTSPLVHSDLLYLLLSILGMLFLGARVEKKLGSMLFFWTQAFAWIGTVMMFCFCGSILYFLSGYDKWMEAKHTGFGPILFCYAVIDSFVGKRDLLNIIVPWLLIPVLPIVLHRVSALSLFSGALFGLLLTRGGLGKALLPNREGVLRMQDSMFGRFFTNSWSSFCPAWPETSASPFVQSMEGSMFSDLKHTYETANLLPMSSKDTAGATVAAVNSSI